MIYEYPTLFGYERLIEKRFHEHHLPTPPMLRVSGLRLFLEDALNETGLNTWTGRIFVDTSNERFAVMVEAAANRIRTKRFTYHLYGRFLRGKRLWNICFITADGWAEVCWWAHMRNCLQVSSSEILTDKKGNKPVGPRAKLSREERVERKKETYLTVEVSSEEKRLGFVELPTKGMDRVEVFDRIQKFIEESVNTDLYALDEIQWSATLRKR